MSHEKKTIEDKVMKQIDTGRVKLRSKYIFVAEKMGLSSAIVLSILIGALFFTLLFYYLDETDNLVYLSFGKAGIYAFLESFPYLLVVCFILLVFLAGYLLKKTDFSYQKPFAYSSISLMVVVIVAGAALTYTGIGRAIEGVGYHQGPPGRMVRPFLHNCFMKRKYGVAGQVVEVMPNSLLLQTPDGLLRIHFQNTPALDPAVLGKFIVVVGQKKGEAFEAVRIQVIPQERIPIIHRSVQHRFPPPPHPPPHLPLHFRPGTLIFLTS